MKKITTIILVAFLFQTSNIQGQIITLDTTVIPQMGAIGYDFKLVQISKTETKYFIGDTLTNTFGLYNMDFTPFLTNIAVPLPFEQGLYQCLYVTRTLFDCDSTNIEYLYTAPTGGGPSSTVFVMRTDGTELLKVDSALCQYCFGACLGGSDWVKPIENTSSGAKLFVWIPLYGPTSNQVRIYSLCGEVPTQVFDFSNNTQSFLKVFPNPSSNSLTFEINPPDNSKEYDLLILDGQSRVLKRVTIGLEDYRRTIDVQDLSSGAYIYSLCTKEKSYQTGKFIVTK